MKRLIYNLAILVFIICVTPRPAFAQATDPYLGEIQTFAFNFCPVNWAALNGQLLSISQNVALFNLLGTNFGGDGVANFALPNWGPIHTANGGTLIACIATSGVYPSRT